MKRITQDDAQAMLALLHRVAAGEENLCAEALALSTQVVQRIQQRKPYPQGVPKSVADATGRLLRSGCKVTRLGDLQGKTMRVTKINARAQTCVLDDGQNVAGLELQKVVFCSKKPNKQLF